MKVLSLQLRNNFCFLPENKNFTFFFFGFRLEGICGRLGEVLNVDVDIECPFPNPLRQSLRTHIGPSLFTSPRNLCGREKKKKSLTTTTTTTADGADTLIWLRLWFFFLPLSPPVEVSSFCGLKDSCWVLFFFNLDFFF